MSSTTAQGAPSGTGGSQAGGSRHLAATAAMARAKARAKALGPSRPMAQNWISPVSMMSLGGAKVTSEPDSAAKYPLLVRLLTLSLKMLSRP